MNQIVNNYFFRHLVKTCLSIKFIACFFFTLLLFVANDAFSGQNLTKNILLLDSIKLDNKVIVVGERGIIMASDNAEDWVEYDSSIDRLLTSITSNKQHQLLVAGHDAAILLSKDQGENWKQVYSDPEFEAPILDIGYFNEKQAVAVGAYGLYLTSNDGGESWNNSYLTLNDNATESQASEIELTDLHLNSITIVKNDLSFIAAESGYIFISYDQGKKWQPIKSPYNGSFFGIEILNKDSILVYGLRGQIFQYNITTNLWKNIESNTNELIHSSYMNHKDEIFLVGYGSTILKSTDLGNSFKKIITNSRSNLTSIYELDNGKLVVTGENGIEFIK